MPEAIVSTNQPVEPGLSPVFCGHTILPGVLLHRSHLMIDRGSFKHNEEEDRKVLVLPVENALAVFDEARANALA